ncbi:MAG: NlpC/P60 family protein [Haloechinothrix sp.]
MQSQHLKRMVSGVVAAFAVMAFVGTSTQAIADPAPVPDNASDALKLFRELSHKAEKLNEDHLKAQDDLSARQKDLNKARGDLAKAKRTESDARADERDFRKVVDKFAGASFTGGAQFNKMSALLTGDSAQDFLERSSALDVIATDQNRAMSKLLTAVRTASQAERDAADAETRTQTARDAAAKLAQDIEARKDALDEQVDEVKAQAARLTAADRALQNSPGEAPPSEIVAPGQAAQTAVDAAMSKRGSPYVYGADGPDSFDCSGLTSWAYNQAGVSIPRSSRAQSTHGTPVPREALQPGDLVFFYNPVSHVGMYIGNGQMVHAPQSGDVVKVAGVMWGDYVGARRVG